MKKIGFLSFGHWSASSQSATRSAGDVLLQSIDLAAAAEDLGADGAVVARPVETGDIASGQIEITDGLEPGERIAVAGVSFLRDGMKVHDLGDALGGSQP